MRKGFEEEVEKLNKAQTRKIQLTAYVAGEGKRGVVNQVNQLMQAINSKPNAIVIQPTDNSALSEGIQEANKRGIPVIAYDQYVVNSRLASYLSSDNYQAGQDNGAYIDSYFEKGKILRIAVFEYAKVSSTMDRIDGFFDKLRELRRPFRVLKRYEAVDPASGTQAAHEFLKDFPKKHSIDLIVTVNDGGGLSVVKTLSEKGRNEIRQATFDGDPASVLNIKAKKITVVDSAQYCAELGRETARTLTALLQNKAVVPKKLIPTFPVTIANLSEYGGWMSVPTKVAERRIASIDQKKIDFMRAAHKKGGRLNLRIGIAPLCPYLCQKSPGTWSGYIYDILKSVSEEYDFALQIESIPNSRLLSNLPSQKIQYAIVPSYLARYKSDVHISGPRFGVTYAGALVSSKSKAVLIDEDYLNNKKVIYADLGDGLFKEELANRATKITGSDVADRMLKMIADGRIDVAIGDYNVLNYTRSRKAQTPLKLLPSSLTGFNTLVLVSLPKNSDTDVLSAYLEQWFMGARQSGELDKILTKYNLSDWQIFLPE